MYIHIYFLEVFCSFLGESVLDSSDAGWTSDTELIPVDLNKVKPRTFIVYKFGCFISELVATHCHHMPVTILLADKIPANSHLTHNRYRNSFFFDATNHMLYLRTARLDSVGEFLLVLVHTLAHIKAGQYFTYPMCQVIPAPQGSD